MAALALYYCNPDFECCFLMFICGGFTYFIVYKLALVGKQARKSVRFLKEFATGDLVHD